MSTNFIVCSPPRVQHLDIQATKDDLINILPELVSLLPEGCKGFSPRLAWRGYRDLEEFVIDKALVLEFESTDLDALLYAQLLGDSGFIGDILLYIIDKEGGNTVATVLVVDNTDDDVVLSQIIREAGIALVDGFYVSVGLHIDNSKLYTIKGHFIELDPRAASARTSYLFTKLAELNLDVRLLLMDWGCRVFYMDGKLEPEEPVEERWVEERKLEPGSMEELVENLRKEDI